MAENEEKKPGPQGPGSQSGEPEAKQSAATGGESAPPSGAEGEGKAARPAGDDARAAAIAAAKAKAAARAAARAQGAPAGPAAGESASSPVAAEGEGEGEGKAAQPAGDDARAAAIAAAKAKAAARAQGGAGGGRPTPAAGARPGRPAKAPPSPPPLHPSLVPIKEHLQKVLTGVSFDERTFRIIGIEVERDRLLDVAHRLREMSETSCDYLACLSGVDYPDGIEVVYHLSSTSTPAEVALRVKAPKDDCHVESVTGIWPGANWHEREAFDLLGVVFDHHPDLRRILLPEGFAGGYPLRKDFKDERAPRERKARVR